MKLFMFHKYTVNARLLQCLTTKTIKKGWFVFLFMRRVILLIWGSCTTHVHQYYFGTVFMLFEFFSGMKFVQRWRTSTFLTQTTTTRRWTEPVWPVVLWLNGPLHRCVRRRFKIFHENKMLVKYISWKKKKFARKFNDQGDIHRYFF